MSFKTIVIVVLTVLITIIFMQNTDEVLFKILWKEIYVSKLWMMLTVTVFGFIIGMIVARPRKRAIAVQQVNLEETHQNEMGSQPSNQKPGISDEDRDYIS